MCVHSRSLYQALSLVIKPKATDIYYLQVRVGHLYGMLQPYNRIRLILSAVNHMRIKSLTRNRTVNETTLSLKTYKLQLIRDIKIAIKFDILKVTIKNTEKCNKYGRSSSESRENQQQHVPT